MSDAVELEKSDKSENGTSSTLYGSTSLAQSQQTAQKKEKMCSPSIFAGLGWLPISVGVFLGLSMIVPYCIAVGLGHVSPGFPYISDTGTEPPESCIFGQLLNLAALFAFATIFVRYKQINEYYQAVSGKVLKWNKAAVVVGSLAAFGMSLVANFQETNMIIVHLIGATMCFALGFVYGFIQSWISYKVTPQHCSIHICRLRLALSFIATILFVSTMVFAGVANSQWEGTDSKKWLPEDGGFALHVVSTASEWGMAIAFLVFFFTYIGEFQKIEIAAEVIRCNRLLVADPLA
ncbi:DNA damage-regulated autophagy modulator protein 2-like isoform X1 [Asterias amurensis]|uniref:DNA damage-regulated autophagy modulator protein 2-like isoform X1 n=2 Tax=Asterias amurensis TaxID=7602 RepID=UPI003AB7FB93